MDELEESSEIPEPQSAEDNEAQAKRFLLEATSEDEGALAWHLRAAQVHATLALLEELRTALNQLSYPVVSSAPFWSARSDRGPGCGTQMSAKFAPSVLGPRTNSPIR